MPRVRRTQSGCLRRRSASPVLLVVAFVAFAHSAGVVGAVVGAAGVVVAVFAVVVVVLAVFVWVLLISLMVLVLLLLV